MESHHVQHLRLSNFRNYRQLGIDLSPGFSVIVGKNGQGKTNLLEALYLLSSTRLLRGIRDYEAITEGETCATVQADVGSSTIGMKVEVGTRKKASLNGMALPRAADLIGRLPCVCISSLDMVLVKGEPADRRLFLDLEISQLSPAYLQNLTHYKRALEQRNALLKLAQDRYVATESFEPWEIQLAHHGAALRASRRAYIEELKGKVTEIHAFLGGGETALLTYVPKDESNSESELLQALSENRSTDIQRRSTSIGPHRDELLITIQDKEARLYGSQGQQRSAVLAMKLATMEILGNTVGHAPLLLLDDILSDLDTHRRQKLSEWVLSNAEQAVLTCTEPEVAGPAVLDLAEIWSVEAGSLSRTG